MTSSIGQPDAFVSQTGTQRSRSQTRRRLLLALLGLAVLAQIVLTLLLFDGASWGIGIPDAPRLQPLAFAPYALAILALAMLRPSRATCAWLILAVTATLQVIALTQPPQTSNDDLRYIWDGKVQLAGIDPYRYVPADPALVRLHEAALFTHQACAIPTGCALINRPLVHTVYPPVAQASFDAVRILSLGGRGGHGGQLAFQIAAALGVLAITALLVRRSRRQGSAPWWPALWGWSPVAVSEFANNAHIDWVAILFSLGAIGAYAALKPRWAGALLGAAIATKVYPVLIAPALMRRHPVKVVGAALAVIVIGYIPHLLAVGSKVIGYFPGYLSEEGYNNGSRLVLLGQILPQPYDTLVGVALMAVLGLICLRRTDIAHPERSAVWLVGAAFLVFSPNYGWYAALLIALVAMTGRWHWLPIAAAPTLTYLYASTFDDRSLIYAYCLAGAIALAGIRLGGRWRTIRSLVRSAYGGRGLSALRSPLAKAHDGQCRAPGDARVVQQTAPPN